NDVIKKLLPGGGTPAGGKPGANDRNQPNQAGGPANGAAKSKSQKNRHPFDSRAPYDKKTDAWMRKALDEIKAGDWKQALTNLQKIGEQPEDSLFRTNDGTWISIRVESRRQLGQAPPAFLEAYRKE